MIVGYCTNVHSGASLDEVLANLEKFALPVKQAIAPNESMGIGLWLSATAARETLIDGKRQRLKSWLDEHQLVAHTFNAFPFHDFHQPVVKKKVYQPDWTSADRAEYTNNIATLMSHLLPEGTHGTISTLPIGWPGAAQPTLEFFTSAQEYMLDCVSHLRKIKDQNGQQIRLCLEPEPGCILQTSDQVVNFMNWYLLNEDSNGDANRPFVGVCHDICHSAVMFEGQKKVLNRYKNSGIPIGKVQISSALQADFDGNHENTMKTLEALRTFSEDRYLHQTCIKMDQPPMKYFEDMPLAIRVQQTENFKGRWRTHYHVPIFMQGVEPLLTTQAEIISCIDWFVENDYQSQFEVETYAWEVSPDFVRGDSLVESILIELRWLAQQCPELSRLNRV